MILTETNSYVFHLGNKSKILIHNISDDRYEIWLGTEPGFGDLIWCRWKQPFWYTFSHILKDKETIGNSTVTLSKNGELRTEF